MKYINNRTFTPRAGASIEYLNNLGITSVDSFLYKPKPSDYENPWKLENIDKIVEILNWGFENNKEFFLQVDSDTDGMTSSAIFYNYFKMLYPDAHITYRVHDGKEHGVILNTVPVYTDIVVIPDAGSNQVDEIYELASQDRHILVMDHHLVHQEIQHEKVAIVNNQTSEGFTNKSLSGAGVVYKVIQAYDMKYGKRILYKQFEDLAALGIIADCMDTRHLDNNAIILNGLKNIRNRLFQELLYVGWKAKSKPRKELLAEKPSFKYLTDKDKEDICSKIGVAFYVAPLINAVIRSGTPEEKLLFFEGFIDNGNEELIVSMSRGRERTETLYQYLARTATNLRAKQNRQKDNSIESIIERIKQKNLDYNSCIIVKIDESNVPQNITGLVAMEISKIYNKPTLVLRPKLEDGIIYYRGSGRAASIPGVDGFLEVLESSGLMDYVEGHSNAFGASVKEDDIPALHLYLNNYYKDVDFECGVEVDCDVTDSNWNNLMLKEFGEMMHVYGTGIPQPKFHFEFNITSNDARVQGADEDSLKISYRGITFVVFKNRELVEHFFNLSSTNTSIKVEIIGRSQINEWMGYKNIQIMIDAIELKGSTKSTNLF